MRMKVRTKKARALVTEAYRPLQTRLMVKMSKRSRTSWMSRRKAQKMSLVSV